MQRLALFYAVLAIAVAIALSVLGANLVADFTERSTARIVNDTLKEGGFDWSTARMDGLLIHVTGPAPTESARFQALNALKSVVNGNRIRDSITVVAPEELHAPRFSLELLRNGDGISLIGLIPEATGRDKILEEIGTVAGDTNITDMLETTDHPEPEDWQASVEFALRSLKSLPRSKISVVPGRVSITAISDSQRQKLMIETNLSDNRPKGVAVILNISAPRPVITPFSLRLIKDDAGTRFDSCSSDTEANSRRILAAARQTGLAGEQSCTIGLGAPTPRWAEAVVLAIGALDRLGGGSLTFSDADITLVAPPQVASVEFDQVVHDLETALPDLFSVHAVLPPRPVLEGAEGQVDTQELLVTKSPEGLVQMRGRLHDQRSQLAIRNFARALFGSDNVHDTTRIDSTLPNGWGTRVLAGLQSLAKLHNGVLMVNADMLEVRGITDRPEARTEVTQILSSHLGETALYRIDLNYEEALNRQLALPTPEECVARINAALAEKQIVFGPGATRIEGESVAVLDRIAELMKDCDEVEMEIGGHTDSQGRETMNQTLSQARAEAVLDGLLAREVLTSHLSAKGYGETRPIADNGSEEGRTRNRRIEFRLIGPMEENATASEDTGETAAVATDSDAETETDAGSDAQADTGTDAGIDTGTDAGIDSGTDTGTDAGLEPDAADATDMADQADETAVEPDQSTGTGE